MVDFFHLDSQAIVLNWNILFAERLQVIPPIKCYFQVGVVCPVVLDLWVHLAIASSARLSRCKQMPALRRRVEDEGRTKEEEPTKAHSRTKTAHWLIGSYCSIKPLIKLITMGFTMMVILKRVSNTATEVTATEVSHPTVFIQYLLLRLILVTSGFKWEILWPHNKYKILYLNKSCGFDLQIFWSTKAVVKKYTNQISIVINFFLVPNTRG